MYVTPGIICYITLSIRPLVIGVTLTMLCRGMSRYRRSMIGFILLAQEAIIAESNLYKGHLKDMKNATRNAKTRDLVHSFTQLCTALARIRDIAHLSPLFS